MFLVTRMLNPLHLQALIMKTSKLHIRCLMNCSTVRLLPPLASSQGIILSIVYSNLHITGKVEVLCSLTLVSSTLIFLILAWKVLDWVWVTPKKMEKILRGNGFKGNSYRLLIGDLKDTANMLKEAKSKPMNFTHDIIPRVMPFINNLVHDYGKKTFIWMGPKATMLILEPDEIREILAGGLVSYDKYKWAKHRRLINPAFNLEKLKETKSHVLKITNLKW